MKAIAGAIAVAALSGLFGLLIWYDYRYPCIQYQAVWVPQWTEIRTDTVNCGRGCSRTIVYPVTHPARWDQECMARGDRHKGDVQAAYAPIPAERSQ